jgi:hypothetical protein
MFIPSRQFVIGWSAPCFLRDDRFRGLLRMSDYLSCVKKFSSC